MHAPAAASPAAPGQEAPASAAPAQNKPQAAGPTVIQASHGAKINPDVDLSCKVSSGLINEVKFSDVYVTPDKRCYIWSGRTNCGLKIVTFDDFDEFLFSLKVLMTVKTAVIC